MKATDWITMHVCLLALMGLILLGFAEAQAGYNLLEKKAPTLAHPFDAQRVKP